MTGWKYQQHQQKKGEATEVMTVGELVLRMGRQAEGINLLEVNLYLKSSKVRVRFNIIVDARFTSALLRSQRRLRATLKMVGAFSFRLIVF